MFLDVSRFPNSGASTPYVLGHGIVGTAAGVHVSLVDVGSVSYPCRHAFDGVRVGTCQPRGEWGWWGWRWQRWLHCFCVRVGEHAGFGNQN